MDCLSIQQENKSSFNDYWLLTKLFKTYNLLNFQWFVKLNKIFGWIEFCYITAWFTLIAKYEIMNVIEFSSFYCKFSTSFIEWNQSK